MSAMAIAAGFQAVGSIVGGFMARQEAKTRASFERMRAKTVRDQATAEIRTRGRQNIRDRGREQAAIAQTGFAMEGDLMDLVDQADIDREMDLLNIAYRGEVQAIGLETQAKLDEAAGRNALIKGFLGAAGAVGGAAASGGFGGGAAISSSGYNAGGMINPSGTGPI